MDGFEQILSSITSNGFPVAVAAYLLLRMESELRALRLTIETLKRCAHCKYGDGENVD